MPSFAPLSGDLDVDVVVIGGGLTGITTAYLLKREGVKVALLERQRCAETDTGHTTAHLTYVTDARLHHLVKVFGKDGARAFWEAGVAAIEEIERIAAAPFIDCDFQWVPGFLHAPRIGEVESKEIELLQEDARLAQEFGFDARFLDDAPYAKRPAVRFEKQAKFHPRKYLAPLVACIDGDGSHVFENTEAEKIDAEPLVVHAGRYRVRCQYLVIATHNPLAGKSSLVSATLFQTKLALYTSYVLGARLPAGTLPAALFWDTGDPYDYLRVDSHPDHDYAVFGGEDCKTGQEENPHEVFNRLETRFKQYFPQAEIQHRWLGQVVETNDGLPFIGESAGQQFVATGFCGNGFTLGTLSALMARDRYLGRKNPWFDLFAVNRKKFHGGTWRYLTENMDFPYYLIRDRLARAEPGSIDDLQVGEGKILRIRGHKTAAYRDPDGKVHLLSPVCTHLKCIVHWNNADKTWDCPCHGSRFKATGEVFSGPAEAPLERLAWPESKSADELAHKG